MATVQLTPRLIELRKVGFITSTSRLMICNDFLTHWLTDWRLQTTQSRFFLQWSLNLQIGLFWSGWFRLYDDIPALSVESPKYSAELRRWWSVSPSLAGLRVGVCDISNDSVKYCSNPYQKKIASQYLLMSGSWGSSAHMGVLQHNSMNLYIHDSKFKIQILLNIRYPHFRVSSRLICRSISREGIVRR